MAGNRPLGITILAILDIIGAVFAILAAAAFGLLGPLIGTALGALGGLAGSAISIVFIVVAVIALIMAYGLWKGKRWAWWLELIFMILGVIGGVVAILSTGIVNIIIDGIIIYYLLRPNVKSYFGIK